MLAMANGDSDELLSFYTFIRADKCRNVNVRIWSIKILTQRASQDAVHSKLKDSKITNTEFHLRHIGAVELYILLLVFVQCENLNIYLFKLRMLLQPFYLLIP